MYEIWYDYMDTNSIIVHIKTDEAGLKKKNFCRHSTLGLQVGSGGRGFFILVEVSLIPRTLLLFYVSLVVGKRTFIRDYRYNR